MQNQIGTDLNIVDVKTSANNIDYNNIWDSEKINFYDNCIFSGIKPDMPSPYHENRKGLRKRNVLFQYTDEELKEIEKCANNPIYFAEKYCMTMTDEGIKNVQLYKFQHRILNELHKYQYNIWVSPRQSSKCVLFDTKIDIFNIETNQYESKYIYEIYKPTNPTLLYKLKKILYKLYTLIS